MSNLIPLPATYPNGLYFQAHSAVVAKCGDDERLAINREGLVRLIRGELKPSIPVDGYFVWVLLEDGQKLIVHDGLSSFQSATNRADSLNRVEA